jgi:hypothetical protein
MTGGCEIHFQEVYVVKRNRKGLLIVLAVALLTFVMSVSAFAATRDMTIRVKKNKPSFYKTVYVGDEVELTIKYRNTSRKLDPEDVDLSSNRKSVATVNSHGVIKAKKAGYARIRAKYGKRYAYVYLTVKSRGSRYRYDWDDDWDYDWDYDCRDPWDNCAYRHGSWRTVCVWDGYLAMRSKASPDDWNIKAHLYDGDSVKITGSYVKYSADTAYVWVYSPRLGCSGFVNADYLR